MSTEITVTHRGIEITYNEFNNQWGFELRGRERSAASLKAAKEAINQPAPKDKKPFTKVKVWKDGGIGYGHDAFEHVTISSIAETRFASNPEVWLTNGKDHRKEYIDGLYTISPDNDIKIAQIEAKRKEIAALQKAVEAITKSLKPFRIPKEIES